MKTDVPARCALGITTVLSVTKIGFGGKGKPQVGYPTALDIFVLICFMSVFAALVEFAVINFITVFINRYKAAEEKRKETVETLVKTLNKKLKVELPKNGNAIEVNAVDAIEVVSVDEVQAEKASFRKAMAEHFKKINGFAFVLNRVKTFSCRGWFKIKPVPEMYIYTNTEDALDSIDEYARKCFPACFLFMMLLYWTSYLYLFEDEIYI